MKRGRILGVVLVAGVGVLIASGCSSTLNDAATVNYHDAQGDHTAHITSADLQDQVGALIDNKAVAASLSKSLTVGSADTSTDARLTASWLTQLIRQKVVQAEFESQHLEVTPDTRTQAQDALRQQVYGPEVFDAFPKWLQDTLVESQAQQIVLQKSCPSGRSVAHILLKTKDEAEAALAQIQAGVPFATVAQKSSIDTSSKNAGGAYGCLLPGEFVPGFQQAAEQATLGVVTEPVKTRFGYHLILASPWDPRMADSPQMAQLLQQAAGKALTARLGAIRVWVDPRYGSWGEKQAADGSNQLAVIPPVAPDPRGKRA